MADFARAFAALGNAAANSVAEGMRFKREQQQRLEAMELLRKQREEDVNFRNAQLELQRDQFKLAQSRFNFQKGETLAAKDSEIAKNKAKITFMERQKKLNDATQKFQNAQFEQLARHEDELRQLFEAGAPDELLRSQIEKTRLLEKEVYGTSFTPMDIDFPDPAVGGLNSGDLFQRQKHQDDLFFKFQDRSQKFSADFQVVQNNLNNIEVATDRIISGESTSDLATQQAVITSYNKILDPTSVVRESEYDRTPENTSLVNRAKAWMRKIEQGGTLTVSDIKEIRDTARAMAALRRDILNKKLEKQIRVPARKRGLNPDEIAPLFEVPEQGQIQSSAPTVFEDITFKTSQDSTQQGKNPNSKDVGTFIKELGLD